MRRPVRPPAVAAAAAGREHTLLLTTGGEVLAAGSDSFGQCAAGGVPAVKTWLRVGGPLVGRKVVAVAAGEYHSVALCDDGAVFVWGFNKDGTLGLGDRSDVVSPRPLPLAFTLLEKGVRVAQVACGGGHTLLRTSDGRLWAVGRGRSGQLGRSGGLESVAAYRTDAAEVLGVGPGKVVDVAAGRDHSLAVVA
jgi:alpha-tubulin suppressor-like RCC1 family protein